MKLKLIKRKNNKPDFDELFKMIFHLKEFLDENPDFNDTEWVENLNTIIDFQDDDGSFKFFDSFNIPSDARVDFCYIPTYICTAILMKAYLTDSSAFTIKEKSSLYNGLKISTSRNLRGHGFEALKGQIEALNLFIKAGLNEFMDLHSDLCPEFSKMIKEIISQFHDMEAEEKFFGPWKESYEDEIKQINQYFSFRKVFVYGTLMGGEANSHYLENSTYLGPAFIEGYEMYDVGWYPAIMPGKNLIIGELYNVPLNDMPSIDMLEGEGSLYIKKCETVTCADEKTLAFVYVYLGDVSNLKKLSSWRDEYVWYVSYGSNMLKDRFLCYIKGGSFKNSTSRQACDNTSLPLAVKTVEIPYKMYFGNSSGSWQGGGVSFLDTSENGKALGVAYLITKNQFNHVAAEENGGRYPQPGYGWYENIISLGQMDGFEVKTITNNELRDYRKPSEKYLNTLIKGIKKNWPEMSDEDIEDYLNNCIRG